MAATRFYFNSVDGDNAVSPAFDSNWEQTGEAVRRKLYLKNTLAAKTSLTDKTVTVPITTTQDILACQFVSDPIPPQRIIGLFSIVIRCIESAATANAYLAYSLRVCSQDGGTIRGTITSSFTTGNEFPTTVNTRIFGNGTSTVAITALTTLPGDRLVLEIGVHAEGPTAATTATERFGTSAASDFNLATGQSTDLNPWAELSQDLFATLLNNYQSLKVGNGMSVGEKIR